MPENKELNRQEQKNLNELYFGVDSQILGELGQNLVANHYVALSELIKNAYDAESSVVTVVLNNVKKEHLTDASEIKIIDFGHGMSLANIKKLWMIIGTDNKSKVPTSAVFGRDKTGNKGIGRFACQRLGRRLELLSVAKVGKMYEHTTVKFNWDEFEPGRDINQIPCEYESRKSKNGSTGLTLKITQLRDHWTTANVLQLKREISLLSIVAPLKRESFQEDPGFKIFVDAEEFGDEVVDLGSEYLDAGWGTLKANVNSSGSLKLRLSGKGIGSVSYTWPEKKEQLADNVEFDIHFLPFVATKELETRRKPKLLTKSLQTKLLNEQSGIRLYSDGFRVYPYGDGSSDWLQIERDVSRRRANHDYSPVKELATAMQINSKNALLGRGSERNMIGAVRLKAGHSSPFELKMDRMGLIENDAYRELVDVIRFSLEWLAIYYALGRKNISDEVSEAKEQKFIKNITTSPEKKDLTSSDKFSLALDYLAEGRKDNSLSEKTAKESERDSEVSSEKEKPGELNAHAKDLILSHVQKQETELAFLRSIASTGPIMFAFAHEVKNITGKLTTNARYLESVSRDIENKAVKVDLLNLSRDFMDTKTNFDHLDNLFGVFSKSYSHKKNPMIVVKGIEKSIKGFTFLLSQFNIDINVNCRNKTVKTPPMREGEFFAVIVNLLSNAIKSCMASNKKDHQISVDVEHEIEKKEVVIIMRDTGVGLSKQYWGVVFEALQSDPEEKIYGPISVKLKNEGLSTLGRGSGMGLSIVKGILKCYRGSISFENPPGKWSASVCVRLPLKAG